jgi:hypothetical protein
MNTFSESFYPTPLPTINAGSDVALHLVTSQTWEAILRGAPWPTLFRFGDGLVRLEHDDRGGPLLRELTTARMVHELALCARWEKRNRSRKLVPTRPPADIAVNVLATPNPPLPVIEYLHRVPVFCPDGTLHVQPGYNHVSHAYYDPLPTLAHLPDTLPDLDDDDVLTVAELLTEDVLGDFPFVEDSDRAHALSFLLLPFMRLLIDGPTPLYLFSKPAPRTGASLCVAACSAVFLGRPVGVMSAPADENEWSRTLLATLLGLPAFVVIDNLPPTLKSSTLAAAITTGHFPGRGMGTSRILEPPVRCAWAATGNNPTLSDELRERVLPIRLDARVEHPEDRTEFRHRPLIPWIAANQFELVWQVLTLIQAWISRGRPLSNKTMGGFESFAAVMGGVLGVGGVSGFLENPKAKQRFTDPQSSALVAFLGSWWQRHCGSTVGVADLLPFAEHLDLGQGRGNSRAIRLGKLLSEQRDRVIGGFTIEVLPEYQGSLQYGLRRSSEQNDVS